MGHQSLLRQAVHDACRTLAERGEDGVTDRHLLERFSTHQDEAAFAALVRRHGALVRGVCGRVLANPQDAEDASQATFLVLARRAATVRWHASISNWLHGVAYRLALRVKAERRRHELKHFRLGAKLKPEPTPDAASRDLAAVLDEELHRLPECYRGPLLLCYLETRTRDQAARRLGCSLRTLDRRLERGRELLRSRLQRRGITFSAVLLAAALSQRVAPAAGMALRSHSLAQAALHFAIGNATADISSRVESLARGAIPAMVSQWKIAALVATLIGLLGAGAGLLGLEALADPPAAAPPAEVAPNAPPARPSDLYGDALPQHALARLGSLQWRVGGYSSWHRLGGTVSLVRYMPDGQQLITASTDSHIRIWDVRTGKEVRKFPSYPKASDFSYELGPHAIVALSPDARTIAGASNLGMKLWDVEKGSEKASIDFKREPFPRALVFSADGKSLFGAAVLGEGEGGFFLKLRAKGGNKGLRITQWDAASGKEIRRFERKASAGWDVSGGTINDIPSLSIATSSDGKLLAAGAVESKDLKFTGIACVWDIQTGKEIAQLKTDGGIRGALIFAPDNKSLAWVEEATIRLWDVASGKELRSFEAAPTGIVTLQLTPDGKMLACRCLDQALYLWDAANGKLLRHIGERVAKPQSHSIGTALSGLENTLAFAPDGKTVAIGGKHLVRFWDISTGKPIESPRGHEGAVTALAVSADGRHVFTRGADNTLRRWELATGKEVQKRPLPEGTANAVFSADGRVVAFSNANAVHVWDTATGKELRHVQVPEGPAGMLPDYRPFLPLALSATGSILAVRSGDRNVHVYDVASGKELRQIADQPEPEFGGPSSVLFNGAHESATLAFSPDGTVLATVCNVNQKWGNWAIRLWDVASGRQLRQFDTRAGLCRALLFSPDGKSLAVANHNMLFDAAPPPDQEGDRGGIMIRGGDEATITLWETATGKPRCQFKSRYATDTLVFSPDGRMLISTSGGDEQSRPGHVVRAWDAWTGKELGHFTGHQGTVPAVAVLPDVSKGVAAIVSGSEDTTVLVWDGTTLKKPPAAQPGPLAAAQLEALWKDLADNPMRAYQAVAGLSAAKGQAEALLKDRIHPVPQVANERLAQLIADLESDKSEVRQKATEELEKLGESARPALDAALQRKPTLDMTQRLQALLDRLGTAPPPPPDVLGTLRAVEVLERVGSPEARSILQRLAQGAARAPLTRQAEAALQRLRK
jgi:RNA polymerase sigma factor (sigma-70 family)